MNGGGSVCARCGLVVVVQVEVLDAEVLALLLVVGVFELVAREQPRGALRFLFLYPL